MEIALHDEYGSKEYWKARRSMRYNSELYDIAKNYRKIYLNSTDENDNTDRPTDWTKEKVVILIVICSFISDDKSLIILILEAAECKRWPIFGSSS